MKILYATDFSKNAEIAFHYTSKLIENVGADLVMLHVMNIPASLDYPYLDDMHKMKDRTEREAKAKLRELYNQSKIDINVDFVVSESISIVQGILDAMDEIHPELVIVGIRGESKVREFLIGSTTKALIRKSPCPVLAVPKNPENSEWKSVLFATDLLETDAIAIRLVLSLLRPFDPEITLAHVSTPPEYEGDQKMEWFKEMIRKQVSYKGINYQLLLSNDIFKSLKSYLERNKFGLLVMVEKEYHSIMDRLFHKDLLPQMEFSVHVPLLTFNEHVLKMKKEKKLTNKL